MSRRSSRLPWLDRLDYRIAEVIAGQRRAVVLALFALGVAVVALLRTCAGRLR